SDSRPVSSRTSDLQSENPGANPGCRTGANTNLEDIRKKTTSFSTDPGSIYCSRWNTLLISPLDAVRVGLVSSLYI
ncbi:MAG TPA: hypothetical protein VFX75_05320, partial [Nitrososphaeraceae archaeon]|nr:hypothetical protein [Nitrososphaeraceae archaeon]